MKLQNMEIGDSPIEGQSKEHSRKFLWRGMPIGSVLPVALCISAYVSPQGYIQNFFLALLGLGFIFAVMDGLAIDFGREYKLLRDVNTKEEVVERPARPVRGGVCAGFILSTLTITFIFTFYRTIA